MSETSLPTERTNTPPRPSPNGGTFHTIKRCCNGCGRDLGDTTEFELHCAYEGLPLPDVRVECGCGLKCDLCWAILPSQEALAQHVAGECVTEYALGYDPSTYAETK